MAAKKKIVVIIEKTDSGFSAYANDFPVFSTGTTMAELLENINEAFSLYFEDMKYDKGLIIFEIDFKQFFRFYKVINSKALAERITGSETASIPLIGPQPFPSVTLQL